LLVSISDSLHRLDLVSDLAEFLPKTSDMDVHGPRIAEILMPPDRFRQFGPSQHLPGIFQQRNQQIKFLGGQVHHLIVHIDGMFVQIDGERAILEDDLLLGVPIDPPQNRLNARNQFCLVERLCDVVVRADLKARDLIGIKRLNGQDDDGDVFRARIRPELAAHLETVFVRQLKVQDDKVGLGPLQLFKRIGSALGPDGDEPFLGQDILDQLPDILVIIDDHDPFFQHIHLAPDSFISNASVPATKTILSQMKFTVNSGL